jgi:hypothetical protein
MSCPTAASLREMANNAPWMSLLQRAEIVGDTWRPSRGVMCFAEDGHPCRSLGERAIDDWLHRAGFEHQVEPLWPRHHEYNPNGQKRADWQVGDLLIEYAGMMKDKEYSAKIASKRAPGEVGGYLVEWSRQQLFESSGLCVASRVSWLLPYRVPPNRATRSAANFLVHLRRIRALVAHRPLPHPFGVALRQRTSRP